MIGFKQIEFFDHTGMPRKPPPGSSAKPKKPPLGSVAKPTKRKPGNGRRRSAVLIHSRTYRPSTMWSRSWIARATSTTVSFDENWALDEQLLERIKPALVDVLLANPQLSGDEIKRQVESLVDRHLDACLTA